jgi:hypothetical protein
MPSAIISPSKVAFQKRPGKPPARKKLSAGKNPAGARPSLYERIKHLAGVIDGPGDLSTNPKHMEGYGRSRSS